MASVGLALPHSVVVRLRKRRRNGRAACRGLVSAGVAAVAVTDHHIIDVARSTTCNGLLGIGWSFFLGSNSAPNWAATNPFILSASFPTIAMLLIFGTRFRGRWTSPPEACSRKEIERVYVSFAQAAKLFHDLGGVVSVHAGRKENSIERIYNAEEFKQAFKEDLAREHIDILEIGSLKDEPGYREIVFPHLGFPLPLIITSDNHNHHSYTRKSICWLKADVTFRGLLHVLHEPIDRVFLGELPPALARVKDNRTRYVRSISVSKKLDSPLTEHWFTALCL